jgi:hypothetical protein
MSVGEILTEALVTGYTDQRCALGCAPPRGFVMSASVLTVLRRRLHSDGTVSTTVRATLMWTILQGCVNLWVVLYRAARLFGHRARGFLRRNSASGSDVGLDSDFTGTRSGVRSERE